MTKANPADLRALGDDLDKCIHDHPDAIQHNPDLANEIMKSRNKAYERFEKVTERPRSYDKNGDLIP
jgi:hypothetical protein